ncbi:peptide-methionine (R)-S-oxide reductase MsrB [Abyssalbus ytuae]|uniref:peptide-methionine (R)-S-oxide reductase n=1 Tax=Abyssalbus ytuae TaxID=2926907 RepID=A0A9E6ZZX5_9FLAO|nr:peptide-methionine (R)-S-oxide reductase MsrB [Abyssalbus ytuae]UOB18247.1 peptide-methionine (R)-S-oxide reductase MsrB [Abyssalbus ytuae]
MKNFLLIPFVVLVTSCNTNAQKNKEKENFPVTKTEQEWKTELTAMEYYVLRKKGTEKAIKNEYNKFYERGTYLCAGCGVKLYESKYKYDSGSGWPAFDRGIEKNLAYEKDVSLGMVRTEVHCANCGGHLGHVFLDGPSQTTGLRHCVNSVSLDFIPERNEEK